MNLKVVREPSKNDYTLGKLYIDGVFECHTIEDVIRPQGVKVQGKTAIPPGRYKLDRKSTRLNSSHMSESRMPSSA